MNTIVGPRKIFLIAALIAGCIGCDQATKWLAKQYLGPGDLISFAGDFFRLQYAENTGAFLSLGASLPDAWRQFAFTILVGVFLAALLLYTIFSAALAPSQVLSLSLLCGGGLSNLIDRVVYDGRVVDFLNVGVGPLRTGIFNVADMAITAAAILLAVDALRQPAAKATLPESRKIDG
jgi:signal peptidase II